MLCLKGTKMSKLFLVGLARARITNPNSRSMSNSNLGDLENLEFLELDRPRPFVTHVKINRPEMKNALNMKLWSEIGTAFQALSVDRDTRAIVLSANGNLFTAGIDLQDLVSMGTLLNSDEDIAYKCLTMEKRLLKLQQDFTDVENCTKPVIGAIHNACVGAGVDLITAVDIRLCTKDAWFQVKEVEVGLAADVGTLQRLPKVIGSQSLVRDLCFTARKMKSEEAEKCGLVSGVFENKESLIDAALDMAEHIAGMSPVAVQGTKINLLHARDHSVEEGLRHMAKWNSSMLQSSDLMKAGVALMSKSKEKPQFSKL